MNSEHVENSEERTRLVSMNAPDLFSNTGKVQIQENYVISVEWKNRVNHFTHNRMLIGLNHHISTTQPRLQPFPSIRILDGEGMIMIGSGEETFQNRLSQTSFNLNNRWSTLKGKDFIEIGVDLDYSKLKNNFLLNGRGQYFYYNIKDFLQNRSPVEFNINQKIAELNEHTNHQFYTKQKQTKYTFLYFVTVLVVLRFL